MPKRRGHSAQSNPTKAKSFVDRMADANATANMFLGVRRAPWTVPPDESLTQSQGESSASVDTTTDTNGDKGESTLYVSSSETCASEGTHRSDSRSICGSFRESHKEALEPPATSMPGEQSQEKEVPSPNAHSESNKMTGTSYHPHESSMGASGPSSDSLQLQQSRDLQAFAAGLSRPPVSNVLANQPVSLTGSATQPTQSIGQHVPVLSGSSDEFEVPFPSISNLVSSGPGQTQSRPQEVSLRPFVSEVAREEQQALRNNTFMNETELVRYQLVKDACALNDGAFLFLNKIYCMQTLYPGSQVSTAPSTPISERSYQILAEILGGNDDISRRNLHWFAEFPKNQPDFKDPRDFYAQAFNDAVNFLSLVAVAWSPFLLSARERESLPLVEDYVNLLQAKSIIIQQLIFGFLYRELRQTRDSQWVREYEKIFERDQSSFLWRGRSSETSSNGQKTLVNSLVTREFRILYKRQQERGRVARGSEAVPQNSGPYALSSHRPSLFDGGPWLGFGEETFFPCTHASQQVQWDRSISITDGARRTRNLLNLRRDQRQPFQLQEGSAYLQEQDRARPVPTPSSNVPVSGADPHRHAATNRGAVNAPGAAPRLQAIAPAPLPLPNASTQVQDTAGSIRHSAAENVTGNAHGPAQSQGQGINNAQQAVTANWRPVNSTGPVNPTAPAAPVDSATLATQPRDVDAPRPVRKRPLRSRLCAQVTEVLKARCMPSKDAVFTMDFYIDPAHYERLAWSTVGISGRRERHLETGKLLIRFRCVQSPNQVPLDQDFDQEHFMHLDTDWPHIGRIQVNGQKNASRRGSVWLQDHPTDLTDLVNEGMNRVVMRFHRAGEDLQTTWVVGVEFIELRISDVIEEDCQHRRTPPQFTLDKVKGCIEEEKQKKASGLPISDQIRQVPSHHGVGENDLILLVDMLDPNVSLITNTPVRSRYCDHFACFDLKTFIQTRKMLRAPEFRVSAIAHPWVIGTTDPNDWRCPVCGGDARPSTLYVDGYFQEVKEQMKRPDVMAAGLINVTPEGIWRPESRRPLSNTTNWGIPAMEPAHVEHDDSADAPGEMIELD